MTEDESRASLAASLRATGSGDRGAFEILYRRTSAKLFGICLRILPDRAEAEEALQEAYLAIWRRAASFDASRGAAMTWLVAVARNSAIDRLRVGGRIRSAPIELADTVADPTPDATSLIERDDDRRAIARCMDGLDIGDRRFLHTAYFEGSSYTELAERAGLPLGTVKSRIRRALLRLRACMSA